MLPVIAVLLIAAAAWGLSSVSQSYTAAAQAQAAIEAAQAAQEAAKAAQIASAGNVVSILTTSMVILLIVALIAGAAWLFYRIRIKPGLDAQTQGRIAPGMQFGQMSGDPNALLSTMMSMMMMQMLQQMQRGMPIARLETTRDEETVDWLTFMEK